MLQLGVFTGAKPVLGPSCMIPYIKIFIYGIIQFGPKTGLASVGVLHYSMQSNFNVDYIAVDNKAMNNLNCHMKPNYIVFSTLESKIYTFDQ